MGLKSDINEFRRKLTKALTKKIGQNSIIKLDANKRFNAKRVLICRPNQRLGNTLLITPLVQEITKSYPEAKIDLFVKGKVAPIVFKNYSQVVNIIELPRKPFSELINYIKVWFKLKEVKYDLVINIEKTSSSGRLATKFSNSTYKLFGDDFEINELEENQIHYGKSGVYQLKKFVEYTNNVPADDAFPKLNLKLNSTERNLGKQSLDELTKNPNKKTIALFTYATGGKCYSNEWWKNFYSDFNSKFSKDYNLIEILPVENISMLNNILPTYYSKDVREIAAVMHHCEVVIAADSGIMHLSCAANTKTIGLFKYENNIKYRPYGIGNRCFVVNDSSHEGLINLICEVLNS